MTRANSTVVFPEGHVQRPVNLVFDAPMAANGGGHAGRVGAVETADVISPFDGRLGADAASGFHGDDTPQAHPVLGLLDPVDLRRAPYPPRLDSAVTAIGLLEPIVG